MCSADKGDAPLLVCPLPTEEDLDSCLIKGSEQGGQDNSHTALSKGDTARHGEADCGYGPTLQDPVDWSAKSVAAGDQAQGCARASRLGFLGSQVTLQKQVWDTSGSVESNRELRDKLKKAHGCVMVYDQQHPETCAALETWRNQILGPVRTRGWSKRKSYPALCRNVPISPLCCFAGTAAGHRLPSSCPRQSDDSTAQGAFVTNCLYTLPASLM